MAIDVKSNYFKTENFNITPAIQELVGGELKVKFYDGQTAQVDILVDDPEVIVVENTSGSNINVDLPDAPATGKQFKVVTKAANPNNIVIRDEGDSTLATTAAAGDNISVIWDGAAYIQLTEI